VTFAMHCFVVPVYGDSPHLGECLQSLAAQEHASPVVVTTPTPSDYIATMAARHGAELRVNPRGGGIGIDWNFALGHAVAPWVTIAHQDDIYLPGFASATMRAAAAEPEAVLAFTGYAEQLDGRVRSSSTLLRIKRALLELGFAGGTRAASRFAKTNVLRFGCAIPCPSVTLNLARTGLRFREDLRIDLDWAAWLQLARTPGAFLYVRETLMLHRVHAASETSAGIAGGVRAAEDRALLREMWPGPVADLIAATYGIAYRSNQT
jgi:hypothetical protein